MPRYRRLGALLIAAAAVALAMTTSGQVANASTITSDQASARIVNQQVAGLLKYNPGAKRIGTNAVQLEKGVIARVHPRSKLVPNVSVSFCSAGHGASVGWLCLYQNANWGGAELDFTVCANRNLGNYNMGNGVAWNDQVSSIDNDQTSSVQSRFYNYDGTGDPNSSSNWNLVVAVNAGHYLRDLSSDTSADGGNANDKIDIVHVCGS
jgi:hypothetical protein